MSGVYKKEADSLTSGSSSDIYTQYIKKRKEIVPIDLTESEDDIKIQPKIEMKDQSTQKYETKYETYLIPTVQHINIAFPNQPLLRISYHSQYLSQTPQAPSSSLINLSFDK